MSDSLSTGLPMKPDPQTTTTPSPISRQSVLGVSWVVSGVVDWEEYPIPPVPVTCSRDGRGMVRNKLVSGHAVYQPLPVFMTTKDDCSRFGVYRSIFIQPMFGIPYRSKISLY